MRPLLNCVVEKINNMSPTREKSNPETMKILYFTSTAGNNMAIRIIRRSVSGLKIKN